MEIIKLIIEFAPLLIRGALMTFKLWIFASLIGLGVGILFGVISSNKLRIKLLSPFIDLFTFVFRAVPFYVQLLVFYFVLPELILINLSAFTAGIFSLGLCSAAYVSQFVKAGINSIEIGQWQACYALGFSKYQSLRFIILPQMFKNVLPSFINELDQILKSTAVISSIGVLELTRSGMNIVSRGNDPLIIYLFVAFLYLLISGGFNILGNKVERKLNNDNN